MTSKTPETSLNLRSYISLGLIAGTVILLDQLTKSWVRTHLALGQTWMPWEPLASYARIVHWQNSGAAFGMFQNAGGLFAILAVLVAAMIIYYFPRLGPQDWAVRLAMSLQLGGALGNLIDRLQHGYVTDFISVSTFPIWNIADASITCGVIVLILDVVWFNRGRQDTAPTPVQGDDRASR